MIYYTTIFPSTLYFAIPSWMTTHITHNNTNNFLRVIFVFTDSIVGLICFIGVTRNKNKKDTKNIIGVNTKQPYDFSRLIIIRHVIGN